MGETELAEVGDGKDKPGPGKARSDYPPGTKIKGPRNQLWRLEAAAHLRVSLVLVFLPTLNSGIVETDTLRSGTGNI